MVGTGIHLRTRSPGGGVMFRRIGLQIIHLDADGNVTSIELVGGNFDPSESFDAEICAAQS